jgi:hypothetical protein
MVTVEKTVERTVQVTAPTPAPAQPTSTAGGTTTPAEADMTCEVGQPCDLSGSTVTVTQVQFFRGVQSLGKTLEGYFVAMDFEYTFFEEEPTDTDQPPFWLSDEDGNVYSLDFEATSSYGIEPGAPDLRRCNPCRPPARRSSRSPQRPRASHCWSRTSFARYAQGREDRPPGSLMVNGTSTGVRPLLVTLSQRRFFVPSPSRALRLLHSAPPRCEGSPGVFRDARG